MYVGGIRLACINDSFYRMVSESMDAKGWLTANPGVRRDVTVINEQIDPRTEIKPNKVCISTEDLLDLDLELGSNLKENRWNYYVDIFAENEMMGIALAGDIFDILRGKMSEVGRTDTRFTVYDYMDDSEIFTCDIENIELNRVRDYERPYNKFWWVVAAQVVDAYYDDQEA